MKEYVLGTDEAEYRRLGLQHRLWAWPAQKVWEIARIAPGDRVLDIGCGPGWAAMDLAGLVGPTGAVVGVDASESYVSAFEAIAAANGVTWASAVVGDVQELASAVAGHEQFDVAWARWVMCFLPSPTRVVEQAASMLKPGGRLVVQDYFNYEAMRLSPRSAIFDTMVKAVGNSWRDSGGNPDVMGEIRQAARKAGLRVTHFAVHQRLAIPGEQMWAWPTVFWKSFLPRIVASGHMTEAEHEDFKAEWARATADPDAFMQLPPVYEMVAEKA